MAVDPGKLQGELVAGRQFAPAGLVAAEQGIGPGADNEFIGRIVAAAGEDGGLLGGEDGALVGPGPGLASMPARSAASPSSPALRT